VAKFFKTIKNKIMKKLTTLLVATFLTANLWAQSPQKMSYQAVIRDTGNALITNTTVGVKISILQATATGTAIYEETQTPTTNANGLVSLEIGTGTVIGFNTFGSINWANGPYFIKTETDPTGGTNYTITGTSQLLSVPYALYAKTAEHVKGKCGYYLGQSTFGGIIFYLDASECHGLVAKSTDEPGTYQWAINTTKFTNAYADAPYGGRFNYKAINNIYPAVGSAPAMQVCKDLVTGSGAYDDWYLPSVYELFLMFTNIGPGSSLSNVGNFTSDVYWSSTESNNILSWGFDFSGVNNNNQITYQRTNSYKVRAVRAF
jgi:hypothetical protein